MSQENHLQLDCLLIAPPYYYGDENNIWRSINTNFPPLGLASVAGYARGHGFAVQIIDCQVVCPTVSDFGQYLRCNFIDKRADIKVIGFTATTGQIKKAYQAAEICRSHYPDVLIVFGGVHATAVTDEVISQKFVDLVVMGEGEITFSEILSGKNIEEIDGLAYKREIDGQIKIIKNSPRRRLVNLDELPMPAYDLLPMSEYRPTKGSYKKLPAMSMMTSRGCPGRCTFCNKTLGAQMVFKSAQGIFREIKYLVDNYGVRQIMFYDDTFTVFRQNVIDLCDLLIGQKLDLAWTCFARVDYVDEAMLLKMAEAGCHQVMYGVENIDEAVLKNINKKINLPQVINAVKWTKQAKIECRLAFMVGNPGDNRQVIEKNIRFIKKISPDLLIVNITTPFPGTEIFAWAKERDLLLSRDWDDYNLFKPVMRLDNLSVEEINKLYRMMYRSFYFRPRYILKKILTVRSYDDLRILLDGFLALLSFFIPKNIANKNN